MVWNIQCASGCQVYKRIGNALTVMRMVFVCLLCSIYPELMHNSSTPVRVRKLAGAAIERNITHAGPISDPGSHTWTARRLPSATPPSRGTDCTVALLIVGNIIKPIISRHVLEINREVIIPLQAHAFLVTEVQELAVEAKSSFGAALLDSVLVVDKRHAGNTSGTAPEWLGRRSVRQFHKLKIAWVSMMRAEATNGLYDVVMKLRPDGTPKPWSHQIVCTSAFNGRPHIHAATDHAWWGKRRDMEVSTGLLDSISNWFGDKYYNALKRPISIRPMLETMLSMPPGRCAGKGFWRFYNKIITLPYPDVDSRLCPGDKAYADGFARHMIDSLRAALCKHGQTLEYIDPLNPQAGDPRPRWSAYPDGADKADGQFNNENAVLTWWLAHNVTVCDLGGNTSSYLYKGHEYGRASEDHCHFIEKSSLCNCSQPFSPKSAMGSK